jgi:hypothetical protein
MFDSARRVNELPEFFAGLWYLTQHPELDYGAFDNTCYDFSQQELGEILAFSVEIAEREFGCEVSATGSVTLVDTDYLLWRKTRARTT